MKIKISMLLALCLGSIAFGAGTLTPPGAPAPTMKTLQQVEPRTPLEAGSQGVSINTNGTISITQSGSYYLTSNLTVSSLNGIVINTNGVTLDLNGFTIRTSSAIASGSGILIQGSNISICNGHIVSGTVYHSGASGNQYTGPGFQNGIYAKEDDYTSICIHDVLVSGCKLNGIYLESWESVVESCAVKTVGSVGIQAGVVNNSFASTCGRDAIYGYQIADCRGFSTGGQGIHSKITVANSYAYSIGVGDGIYSDGTVVNSYGYTTGNSRYSDGIQATEAVQNSYGFSLRGDGIRSKIVRYSSGRSTGTASSADGIDATIAIGCIAEGGEHIAHKYLMP